MSNKWFYSVALGAMFIAAQASGLTVKEAMSMDMRYDRPDYDAYVSAFVGFYKSKITKHTTGKKPDGSTYNFWRTKFSCPNVWAIKWQAKDDQEIVRSKILETIDETSTLKARREGLYKDKVITQSHAENPRDRSSATIQATGNYLVKPSSKKAQPMGPYAPDDWFAKWMDPRWGIEGKVYDVEHNAVTNIVSDNEAYITGTILHSGHIDTYYGSLVARHCLLRSPPPSSRSSVPPAQARPMQCRSSTCSFRTSRCGRA